MARPRQQLLSPEIIADAAMRLVAKNGDFTIPGVAAALGVHPSSLYHHLPGGRLAIVHQMRQRLYSALDLGSSMDSSRPALDRLRQWMRAYRSATAQVPEAVTVLVGAQVEDRPTLEIYEALFVILRDAGVPREQRVAASAMIDAVVLGSAVDAGSPVPLWRIGAEDLPELRDVAATDDDERRNESGFELAVDAVVVAVASMSRPG
ncbi:MULTISPECIES: TetR/AcrR family transcriptional regulator [unclassified Microcella]|uniref:TetR/AcrR family transcriptional regulator n=1 Tax=unclassified Microcella TaxID=2630066 RepID=UPI0006F603F7|nr:MULTISPECIES: TetR/AcrR family transcriptional regulator C-terminal domain-containing protein [unclassified Microcella]KQV26460.1 hypothetical protein ASC54_06165 [Yonghaparkia sp. Root332]KRF32758.1 hypothetical protein ASG83_01560 [Yonghaparkia sp. Soil809]